MLLYNNLAYFKLTRLYLLEVVKDQGLHIVTVKTGFLDAKAEEVKQVESA